jgi:hypothetical protein
MRTAIVILTLLVGAAPAFAGEGPSRIKPPAKGTFRMREELKGQHPRLFFTKADIPELRRRALGPNKWYLDRAKETWQPYVGQDVPAQFPDWKRYLYGFWALSAMDLLSVVEEKPVYAETAKKWVAHWLKQENWGGDDLIPMDILSGVAITYDVLYDQFTPAEQKAIRERLHKEIQFIAKRFYVGQYWTGDYQNNHMHNRINGLATAAFAVYGDDPAVDVQAEADLALDSVRKVVEWAPEDGSNHEGPGYWSYGHHWAARIVELARHVTGEDPAAKSEHFRSAHLFRIYLTAPGWKHTLNIGDGEDGPPGSLTSLWPSISRAKDGRAAQLMLDWQKANRGEFYNHTIWGLLWRDPQLALAPVEELPLWRFWPDLEMFSIRSSWKEDATAFVFKCGPLGGHRLQELRGKEWANVAHDHPDQNHFLLFAHGAMLAEDDGYPKEKKLARSHNTVTVDGGGQPREGTGWCQPFDHALSGTMDDVFLTHNTAFASGNASRLYTGAKKFVRHVAFVDGSYVIALDDLESDGPERSFEWRLHKDGRWNVGESGTGPDAPRGWSVADKKDPKVSLDVTFLSSTAKALEGKLLPAELTAKPCLAVTTRGKTARFLAVLTPCRDGQPKANAVRIDSPGAIGAARVEAGGFEDFFAVREDGGRTVTCGPVRADARAVVLRRRAGGGGGGEVRIALMVRGTELKLDGKTLLAAPEPVNLSWRRGSGGVVVEAERPYKDKSAGPRKTDLRIGGLVPGKSYAPAVNGEKAAAAVTATAEGLVPVTVDLEKRCTVVLPDATVGAGRG